MNTVTVANISNENFNIASVDNLESLGLLKSDLIKRGFDGRMYDLDRVVTGKKRAYRVTCIRSEKTGQFFKL